MLNTSFSRLYRSVLLALGMTPGFLFAEATPEAEPINLGRGDQYSSQLTVGGTGGNRGSSEGDVGIWGPLWQRADRLVFLDLQGYKGEGKLYDGGVGLGYRWLQGDYQYGLYSYYDGENSTRNNFFKQFTVGFEFKNQTWGFTGNYYQPFDTRKYRDSGSDTGSLQAYGNYQSLWIERGYNYALGGGDIEYGHATSIKGLTAYAGYFYLTAPGLDKAAQGPKLRTEYRLDKAFGWDVPWLNRGHCRSQLANRSSTQ